MGLCDYNLCTGCGACAAVCGNGSIKMIDYEAGFLVAVKDTENCVNCGKCEEICPVKKPRIKSEQPEVYALRAKNGDIVNSSTSGGAFSLLASEVLSEGGKVYGAGFKEDFTVIHKAVEKKDDIPQLSGSKYVQSFMGDTFREVKADLKSGRKVLFSGTPCQCAGLRAYLAKEYDNLLVVDFVCHGVPSPDLYRRYLDYMSGKGEIASVCFRDKSTEDTRPHIAVRYKDGSIYRKYTPHDPYMLAFIQNISLRRSCFECAFKGLSSGSDITMGDFWGIENTDSPLKGSHGVSLFIVNTQKGNEAFLKIQKEAEIDQRTLEEAVRSNSSVFRSSPRNPLRGSFIKDIHKYDINKLSDKYCGSSPFAKARRAVAKLGKDR